MEKRYQIKLEPINKTHNTKIVDTWTGLAVFQGKTICETQSEFDNVWDKSKYNNKPYINYETN